MAQEQYWVFERKRRSRSEVERILAKRFDWWWRKGIWNRFARDRAAFLWEMARRYDRDPDSPPFTKLSPVLRLTFANDETWSTYPIGLLDLARANAGQGRRVFGRRRWKSKGADDYLLVVDLSFSNEEIIEEIRKVKKARRIPGLTGSDAAGWSKIPWRWAELLDIKHAVSTPRLNDGERRALSSAKILCQRAAQDPRYQCPEA